MKRRITKRERVVFYCSNCGAKNILNPPKRKLKKTDIIQSICYNCEKLNENRYLHNLKLVR